MSYIPAETRRLVAERAQHCCEYCQSQEVLLGMPFEIEHVVPISAGGETAQGNLCLACPRCNRHKGTQLEGHDVATDAVVTLFNPRDQVWPEHFSWSIDGIRVIGETAIGRVTIEALQMNNTFILRARQLWVTAGWHPPR